MAIGNMAVGVSPINSAYTYAGPSNQVTATQGMPQTSGGGLDSILSGLLSTGASVYGSQNAAEAQNKGILAGITTQQQTMGNINNLFGTQVATGNNALTALGKLQGINGAAPDYSGFENSPGYQFALQQGQNAIRSAAASNGSAYTPNTLYNIGQFVTGTASQNYNNYVNQLLQTAGIGAQANNTLAGANLQTGGNISQLQQNSGVVQGAGVNSTSGTIGNALSQLLGGANGSGVISGIGSLLGKVFGGSGNSTGTGSGANLGAIGSLLNGAGSFLQGGQNGTTPFSDYNPVTGQGTYTDNSLFNNFAAGSGYDPTTGQYNTPDQSNPFSGASFSQFSNNSGYDPNSGNYNDTGLGNLDFSSNPP